MVIAVSPQTGQMFSSFLAVSEKVSLDPSLTQCIGTGEKIVWHPQKSWSYSLSHKLLEMPLLLMPTERVWAVCLAVLLSPWGGFQED